jgi:hypothetical protein
VCRNPLIREVHIDDRTQFSVVTLPSGWMIALRMNERALIRAAEITLRRVILERFRPGAERGAWLRWMRARYAEGSDLDPQVECTNEGRLNFFLGENPVVVRTRALLASSREKPKRKRPLSGSGSAALSCSDESLRTQPSACPCVSILCPMARRARPSSSE